MIFTVVWMKQLVIMIKVQQLIIRHVFIQSQNIVFFCYSDNNGGTTFELLDSDLDGICDADEIYGCLDLQACNYNPDSTDAGECQYGICGDDCENYETIDEFMYLGIGSILQHEDNVMTKHGSAIKLKLICEDIRDIIR